MKKRKKIFNCEEYQKCILKNSDNIWIPKLDIKLKNDINDTWFDINKYKNNKIKNKIIFENNNEYPEETYICKKVELKLTNVQKIIFDRWFDAFTIMYNTTINFIKRYYQKHKTLSKILNFRKLRDIYLKVTKRNILKNSQIDTINYDTKIKTHILDRAIHLVITNFKSKLSNLRNGNINKFRTRYWRFNSKKRIMEIEPTYFRQHTICKTIFGQIKAEYNNKNFDLDKVSNKYKSACKLQKNNGRYYLFVPNEIKTKQNKNKRKYISLDPGVRTFLTGISDNEVIKVEHNRRIKKYLKRLDNTIKIKNKSRQNKKQQLYRRKLGNLRDELHWKTINYLTTKYRNIFIGDMSVKEIISTDNNLESMTKRIAISLSLYKFKQRLINKCDSLKINYKEINECYTSVVCSVCSWKHPNLKGNKIFECQKCKKSYDRDINASRGILLKAKYL